MLLQTLLLCVVKKYVCFKRRINLLALVSEFCRTKGFVSRLRETFVFRGWWLQPLPGRQPSLAGGPFSPRDTAAPSGRQDSTGDGPVGTDEPGPALASTHAPACAFLSARPAQIRSSVSALYPNTTAAMRGPLSPRFRV